MERERRADTSIDMDYAIGIDIGGRNVKGVAATPAGKPLANAIIPTGNIDRKGWTKSIRETIEQLTSDVGRPAKWLGVAAPGLAARDQRSIAFMPGRFPGLEGLDWGKHLRFTAPVPVLNDAHATLLGEVWLGAARNKQNTALLTLGTGVGGAAIVDGQLLRGHIGRGGHFGHMSLNPDGAPDVANTPGSLENAIGDATVTLRSDGRFNSTRALIDACSTGDREARAVWNTSIKALAAGLASIINALDPEVIVVGGGITQAGDLLFRPLRRQVRKFEWQPGGHKTRIVPAKLGDRAGAYGSAWNAMNHSPSS